jgi:hypothetical protein
MSGDEMRQRALRMPPRRKNPDGSERRVGVELEFASISARACAEIVRQCYGGSIEEEDPHRLFVRETTLGSFTCELDTQYAHRPYGEDKEAAGDADAFSAFRAEMRRIYGDISSLIVPCEIVGPPIALSRLAELDVLVERLVTAGASGTKSSPFYAFGTQLNPEIATEDSAWITAVLKAYLLVSDWLRAVIRIDGTRQFAAFAEPFPPLYISQVVSPDYWPSTERLIDDYLAQNATRNRELDMLPLFMELDSDRVRRVVRDLRVVARPTFHYRLPDAKLGDPDWDVMLEWNRWCVVEELAEKRDVLDRMGAAYIANDQRLLPRDWSVMASEWLVLS